MEEKKKDFLNPDYYRNRELSWLAFNYRVLSEARDKTIPLLERVKFLGITASNLDEFVMVRVASLKDMVHADYTKPDIAGLKAGAQLALIGEECHRLVDMQYNTYNRSLLPLLEKQGIRIITKHEAMTEKEREFADRYFDETVYPVLTPMAVDPSRPFPLIRNKTLNIAALLQKKKGSQELEFATVQVPSVLPRLLRVPSESGTSLILLEEVIERNIARLFLNYCLLYTSRCV